MGTEIGEGGRRRVHLWYGFQQVPNHEFTFQNNMSGVAKAQINRKQFYGYIWRNPPFGCRRAAAAAVSPLLATPALAAPPIQPLGRRLPVLPLLENGRWGERIGRRGKEKGESHLGPCPTHLHTLPPSLLAFRGEAASKELRQLESQGRQRRSAWRALYVD